MKKQQGVGSQILPETASQSDDLLTPHIKACVHSQSFFNRIIEKVGPLK